MKELNVGVRIYMSACYKYLPLTMMVSIQSNNGCSLWCPVVMILWKTYKKTQRNHSLSSQDQYATILSFYILSSFMVQQLELHYWIWNHNNSTLHKHWVNDFMAGSMPLLWTTTEASTYDDEEICMSSSEHWNVHWNTHGVRLV